MKNSRLFLIITMLVLYSEYSQAQEKKSKSAFSVDAVFNFRLDRAVFDSGYMTNSFSFKELDRILSDTSTTPKIDSIRITATSSIDGSIDYNQALALRRARAIRSYIIWKYPQFDTQLITTSVLSENWEGLKQCVEQDDKVPCRSKVLEIIDQNVNPETKEWRLRQVAGGTAWKYIMSNFFKHLRVGSARVEICCQQTLSPAKEQVVKPDTITVSIPDKSEIATLNVPKQDSDLVILLSTDSLSTSVECQNRHPLALKTNLLFDAALVPNLGVECYLGRGWSIGGNWMYAWWSSDKRHDYWRTYGGELDLRKYFRRRANEKPLTGHHLSLYGQMFTYDFEMGGKGYLSNLSYGVGVEYGYSLPIGRRLNLDFGIGVGYLGGEYKEYRPIDTHYVWQQTKQRHWFGPTKAEVSLVWLIGCGNVNEGKGGRQ